MARKRRFESRSRPEQRVDLLRRLRRIRRDIEQQMRDKAYWNELQRSRGGPTLPNDPTLIAALARVDQMIEQVRGSR